MYKFLKIIISNLFIVLVVLNQNAISKPLPPGSGAGDVPANILILLDSSASMNRKLSSGSGIDNPNDIVEDSAGNLIVGEGNLGFVKILTADNTVDPSFAPTTANPLGNRNFRGSAADTCTLDGTNNSIVGSIRHLSLATSVKGVSGDVIYGTDQGSNPKIVGINTSGECIEVITNAELGNFRPLAMEVRTIGGEDHLFASGKVFQSGMRKRFYTKNLTTGDTSTCGSDYGGNLGNVIERGFDLTVDNSGGFIYYTFQGHIYGYALTKTGDNYCPSDEGHDRYYSQGSSNISHRKAEAIQVSPDSDSIMYVASSNKNVVQKVSLTGDRTLTSVTLAGRDSEAENTASAGALSAAEVNLKGPKALFVTSTKVWVSDKKATIQEFDENKFTVANIDTSWQAEYGGKKETRFEGAKRAIKAVVSDSSLTAGANFGYGFWNAGVLGEGKGNINTVGKGYYCHVVDGCDYYRGWNGEHPLGRSQLFNSDSGISVGISKEGASQIPEALDATSLQWGTDANAFAQLADEYFEQHKDALNLEGSEAEEADCQISYVIVIGDGEWTHGEQAVEKIRSLRQNLGVKTLVVAYGGGLNASGLRKFDAMALAGSCDDAGSPDCQARIDADTPQMLKTELASKIQQIIAEKLSFTAPSITATIQEGGSLYQAQFEYIQYGEWRGTISRQSVKGDGSLNADSDEENWNAAEKLKNRSNERNIWTTLPDNSYIGNWNNWTTDDKYLSDIESLFDLTGNSILDYHNTTSNCSSADDVEDGINDDIKGLINFVRGIDYFDYDGDCNIIEKRAHLLGDVYNSQLVEVGPPDANSNFTDVNQEAYWRAKNNYQSFVSANQSRQHVIYAGANDGMLHAFNSITGEEEWGFIPPFIASKLPTIINKAYDGKFAGDPGGTNPIFAVDGSPVVHDMYIQGLNADGAYEEGKSWRTILMIPYGRGGAGFSVLDVTNPIINGGQGPLHMYSVFNDHVNSKVLVADNTGQITEYQYTQATINIDNSEEAKIASENQNTADAADSDTCEDDNSCTQQDALATYFFNIR
ncbi:PilC/PilY family type IV pilus protein [Candidatus Pelagibacter sp.]|nr:PilC/PilY family type IV pilus protein [Candidatus Pelagibacter sp.]